jgi:hypothetical protein
MGSPVGLSLVIVAKSKDDYQSGIERRRSKASRSFTLNLMPLPPLGRYSKRFFHRFCESNRDMLNFMGTAKPDKQGNLFRELTNYSINLKQIFTAID